MITNDGYQSTTMITDNGGYNPPYNDQSTCWTLRSPEVGTPIAAGALSGLSSWPKKALKVQTARPARQTDNAMT
jgi:hypothetical protein